MKQVFFIASILFCTAISACAQYTMAGKIEYERKVNIHAQMKEMEEEQGSNPMMEQMKSRIPKFNSSFFDLVFDSSRSIYKPGKEVEGNVFKMFGGGPATENIVLTDLAANKIKANKKVFDQKFFGTNFSQNLPL